MQRFYDARANANLKLVGAAPPLSKTLKQKIHSNVDPDGAPAARESDVVDEKPKNQLTNEQNEIAIDSTQTVQQSVKELQPIKKEFKEYSDIDDADYLDVVGGRKGPAPRKQLSDRRVNFCKKF